MCDETGLTCLAILDASAADRPRLASDPDWITLVLRTAKTMLMPRSSLNTAISMECITMPKDICSGTSPDGRLVPSTYPVMRIVLSRH